uniref:Polymerase nucleotidyl transferase domain-containing protein n=1 Tax=uncultured marine crenarchaeote E37-7F TaxID=907717 RepID=G9BAR8_9ARCH|nr:conserved hypothetical protein [uncultured marine crenarchaeote E37-7F]
MKFSPLQTGIVDHAVSLVVSACEKTFTDNLVCITLKGSTIKGDFFPGYSDLDFHVFLKPEVMDGEKCPKVEGAIRFQKAFGNVNPEDFGVSQFQIYFINSKKYPSDWLPPVKGTYKIIWGKLPSTAREMDDLIYLHQAKQFLTSVEADRKKIVERFVDKTNTQIPQIVRLLGAVLKSYMYSVSMLLTLKPRMILRTKLDKLIQIIEEGIESKGHFSKYFDYVSNWNRLLGGPDQIRDAFREGTKALDEIICWYNNYQDK